MNPLSRTAVLPAAIKVAKGAAAVALALFVGTSFAHADPIITIPNVTVTSPGSGSFDATISVAALDLNAPYDLSSFTLEFDVPSGSGITFTGVSFPSNYVFAGNSFDQANSATLDQFAPNPTGGTHGHADDSTNAPNSFTQLTAGSTFNLAHFTFTADPGLAPSTVIPVTIDLVSTSLSDENANPIPFTPVDGSITIIQAGPAVPEPTTVALFGLGFAGLVIARFWRRKPAAV